MTPQPCRACHGAGAQISSLVAITSAEQELAALLAQPSQLSPSLRQCVVCSAVVTALLGCLGTRGVPERLGRNLAYRLAASAGGVGHNGATLHALLRVVEQVEECCPTATPQQWRQQCVASLAAAAAALLVPARLLVQLADREGPLAGALRATVCTRLPGLLDSVLPTLRLAQQLQVGRLCVRRGGW